MIHRFRQFEVSKVSRRLHAVAPVRFAHRTAIHRPHWRDPTTRRFGVPCRTSRSSRSRTPTSYAARERTRFVRFVSPRSSRVFGRAHRAEEEARVRREIVGRLAPASRTISSGDNTPNCTARTDCSSHVECGNRSCTLILATRARETRRDDGREERLDVDCPNTRDT